MNTSAIEETTTKGGDEKQYHTSNHCQQGSSWSKQVVLSVNVHLKSHTAFVHLFFHDATPNGFIIRTRDQLALSAGTSVGLRFLCKSGEEIFTGRGHVVWNRRNQRRSEIYIRFCSLPPSSRKLHNAMVWLKNNTYRFIFENHQEKKLKCGRSIANIVDIDSAVFFNANSTI
jgi:hypothetical protein